MTGIDLRRWVSILGGINALCYAAYAVLTYGMVPASASWARDDHEIEVFARLGQSLSFLGPAVQGFLTGESELARRDVFLLAYGLPVVVSTGVFIGLLLLLARHRENVDRGLPRALFGWAACCALLSMLAAPVLVEDFWWSVAWGRVVVAGINPYYTTLTPELYPDLPIVDDGRWSFTYGPLWAIVLGGAMLLAGGNGVLAAVLLKLLLAGAWLLSLRLIWALLAQESPWRQCLGIAIFGWLPVSLLHAVADGHNDVIVASLILLWLYGLERSQAIGATLALVASVLVKYVSAPLFMLDLLHTRFSRKERIDKYLPQAVAAAMVAGATLAPYMRSLDVFSATWKIQGWLFFSIRATMSELERWFGLPNWGSTLLPMFFVLLAMHFIRDYMRHPGRETFWKATLGVTGGLLFSAGHNWPWFLLWVLGVAALVPGTALTRWVVGVALAAPFPILVGIVGDGVLSRYDRWTTPGLALYAFALLWFVLAPRYWFRESGSAARLPAGRLRPSLGAILGRG